MKHLTLSEMKEVLGGMNKTDLVKKSDTTTTSPDTTVEDETLPLGN